MKLSIQNVIDWLNRNHYEFSCDIRSTDALFTSVNLSTENVHLDDVILVCNFMTSGSKDSNVYIATKYGDVIVVLHADLQAILNSLVNLFDYFNGWEMRLLQVAMQKGKLEELGFLVEEFFAGSALLWSADGYPRLLTTKYETNSNPIWRDIIEGEESPEAVLTRYNKGRPIYPKRKTPGLIQFPNREEQVLYCPILRDGELIAAVAVFKQSRMFLPGDLNYLDYFVRILSRYMILCKDVYLLYDYLGQYLRSLISQESCVLVKRRELSKKYSWYEGKRMTVLVASTFVSYDPVEAGTLKVLKQRRLPGACFIVDRFRNLVVLVNRVWNANLDEVSGMIRHAYPMPVCIGVSADFTDLADAERQYRAACLAKSYCNDEKLLVYAKEIISQEMRAQFLQNPELLAYVHPALRILHAYDRRDGTRLLKILHTFMFNECNYSETAKKLHMSRTTLIQHINRIRAFTDVDFNDIEQFQAILYSFILYKDSDLY